MIKSQGMILGYSFQTSWDIYILDMTQQVVCLFLSEPPWSTAMIRGIIRVTPVLQEKTHQPPMMIRNPHHFLLSPTHFSYIPQYMCILYIYIHIHTHILYYICHFVLWITILHTSILAAPKCLDCCQDIQGSASVKVLGGQSLYCKYVGLWLSANPLYINMWYNY